MIDMNHKYQTRNGRAVRILCVDGPGNLCVYGIVTKADSDFINPMRWERDGRFSWSGYCPENDLIPVPTKHEAWAWVSDDGRVLGFCDRDKTMMQATCEPNEHVKLVTWEES